jgi:hypothetical protein
MRRAVVSRLVEMLTWGQPPSAVQSSEARPTLVKAGELRRYVHGVEPYKGTN